jgi:hypothetical protein
MIPWPLIVPCKGYLRGVLIWRRCPEIRKPLSMHYRQSLVGWLKTAPLIPVMALLYLLAIIGEWAENKIENMPRPGQSNFDRARQSIDDCHAILHWSEIKKRIEA